MCCYVFISLFAMCIYIYLFAIYLKICNVYIFICNIYIYTYKFAIYIYIYKFAIYLYIHITLLSLFWEPPTKYWLPLCLDSGGGLSHECLVAAVLFWLGNFIHVFHVGRHDCVMTAIVKIWVLINFACRLISLVSFASLSRWFTLHIIQMCVERCLDMVFFWNIENSIGFQGTVH